MVRYVGSRDTSAIPPKIQAAQEFLHYTQRITNPASILGGDAPISGNELSTREQAAHDAAINVMIQYFNGEMDYGDPNPGHPPDHDDDGTRDPVPVG